MFENLCHCPQLVDIPIRSVQKSKVMDYIQARMENDNAGSATVNKETSFIKRMVSFAVEYELLDKNPLDGLKKLLEPEKYRMELPANWSPHSLTLSPISLNFHYCKNTKEPG